MWATKTPASDGFQAYSIIASDPYPALAVEAVRIAEHINTPILGGTPPWLKVGPRLFNLAEDGSIRFVASNLRRQAERTVSAIDVINGTVAPGRFTDQLVFVGSSLPNMGGLRESAAEPLVASVQIHADLANSVLTGFVPVREDNMVLYETLYTLLGGLAIALLATRYRPPVIVLGGLGVIALSLVISILMFRYQAMLVDGLTVSLALGFVLLVTSYCQFAFVRGAERRARQRFSQYLPQSVVARYLDSPEMGKIAGEERQVTALFTDIEGFSVLAKNIGPRELIAMLDIYYGEVTRLIGECGGMIDKIVGDAVHAMFNAPEDLDDHVNKAIDCALKISRLTEEMRRRPVFAGHQFGRTRIGIETGMAVFGEVGAGGKLDYTAHGDAINLAARLQDANKFLGTTICIGPQAASESRLPLDNLGEHEIRGFGIMTLYAPKPTA